MTKEIICIVSEVTKINPTNEIIQIIYIYIIDKWQ